MDTTVIHMYIPTLRSELYKFHTHSSFVSFVPAVRCAVTNQRDTFAESERERARCWIFHCALPIRYTFVSISSHTHTSLWHRSARFECWRARLCMASLCVCVWSETHGKMLFPFDTRTLSARQPAHSHTGAHAHTHTCADGRYGSASMRTRERWYEQRQC